MFVVHHPLTLHSHLNHLSSVWNPLSSLELLVDEWNFPYINQQEGLTIIWWLAIPWNIPHKNHMKSLVLLVNQWLSPHPYCWLWNPQWIPSFWWLLIPIVVGSSMEKKGYDNSWVSHHPLACFNSPVSLPPCEMNDDFHAMLGASWWTWRWIQRLRIQWLI